MGPTSLIAILLTVGAAGDDDGGTDQGAVWILFPNADGTVKAEQKISETSGGFGGALDASDRFGSSASPLGDLDGDGISDLAVCAYLDDDGGTDQGAVWILFLDTDGTVQSEQKISETAGGFAGALDATDLFGTSAAFQGDLDGDGIGDLAVGATRDDDGGTDQGAVWVLFLDTNGTVKSEQKISETVGGFGGVLDASDYFGSSLASVGDLDGDGIGDLAVGAVLDDDGDSGQGAVWILFLNADGTVKSEQKISETTGGFGGTLDIGDLLGMSLSSMSDLDGDGIDDLAVGADLDDDGGMDQGAVWILFLNVDGTVKGEQKIIETVGGFSGILDTGDFLSWSACSLGDLDADGVVDLAVGAIRDDDGGANQGAVWILFLEGDTSPPMIICPADITEECTSPSGAAVTFSPTAMDDADPTPSVVCVPASGSTFPPGTTTVTCTATDNFGNSSMCSFDVDVIDMTPPTIVCPPSMTVSVQKGITSAPVTFTASASDLCDPAPALVCVPPPGSLFPVGTTTVTCTATDASGNASVCSFEVTVQPPVRRRRL